MAARDKGPDQLPVLPSGLADLGTDEQRQEFFSDAPELLQTATVERLSESINRLVREDLEAAERLSATAAWVAEALDDDLARGRHLRAAGNLAFAKRAYREAAELYETARGLLAGVGHERETLRTLYTGLLALSQLGRYDKALEWAEEAERLCQSVDDPLLRARLEFNIGHLSAQRDRWRQALRRFRSAHASFLAGGQATDIGAALRNIAVSYQQLNEIESAVGAYQEALDYCSEHGLTRLALELEYNFAYLFYLRGQYSQAIRRLESVRERCVAGQDHHHMALCDLDLAEVYLELNLPAEAERLAHRAAAECGRLGMEYEGAKAMTQEAFAAHRQGRWRHSLGKLAEAHGLFATLGNRYWVAVVDLFRAQILHERGMLEQAVPLVRSALAETQEIGLPVGIARCEIQLARICLGEGVPETAREHCASALRRIEGLGMPALESRALLVLALASEAAGDPGAALAELRRALAGFDRLRGHLAGDELKVAFSRDQQEVYEALIALLLTRDGESSQTAAFEYVQSAKSRALIDLLGSRVAEVFPVQTGQVALAQEIRKLREEVHWYARQVDVEESRGERRSDERLEDLRSAGREREQRLLRLLRRLQAGDPELAALQGAVQMDLGAIRASLSDDTQLLEYFIARDEVYLCLLDQDGLEVRRVAEASTIRSAHRQFQLQLGRFRMPEGVKEELAEHTLASSRRLLRRLYDDLVGPVRDRLRRHQLIVAPHGFLHQLPFHALHDGEQQLIDHFSISYVPSATVLSLCARRRGERGKGATVLGVPDERAPLIRDEVEAIAKLLPDARLFVGEEANEESLERFGTGCRLLHIASHGLFRRDNPMFSAIRLGGGSRLSLFDLYNLRLRADLAVLSGCSTGLSAVHGADELIGLTRGLLYAGARSVLVALWDVDDRSTFEFMPLFYRHLADGSDPVEALQAAQRQIRERYPHPYHWAPFVLVGWSGSDSIQRPSASR